MKHLSQTRGNIRLSGVILFLALLMSCSNHQTGLESSEETDAELVECTKYESPDGLIYELNSRSDRLPLYESFVLELKLKNQSDTATFKLTVPTHQYSFPFQVFTEQESLLYSNAEQVKQIQDVLLTPNDSISLSLFWPQNEPNTNLKAYAGNYFIKPLWMGVPSAPLGKWVTITEVGPPLSATLENVVSEGDSLKFDYILRNRISSDLELHPQANHPLEIKFIDPIFRDIKKTIYPPLSLASFILAGKTTVRVFQYAAAKNDSLFSGLNGQYICRVQLTFEQHNPHASFLLSFP